MPPPGSPPVTMWVISPICPGSDASTLFARYWANEGVERRVSARPALRPKTTRSVSPGATGTDLQPMRERTKCVWPATNGPAPNVVSTLLWSWSHWSPASRPGACEVMRRLESKVPRKSSQGRPIRHLGRVQPGTQVRLGEVGGARNRAPRVFDALPGELANALFHRGHRFVRPEQARGHVADGGARIAHKVGQGGDAALPKHLERRGRVRHVRPRRHHSCLERSSS